MIDQTRRFWVSLLVKLVIYHAVLFGGLLGGVLAFPDIEPFLPIGGVFEIGTDSVSFEDAIQSYREQLPDESTYRRLAALAVAGMMSLSLVGTLLAMIPISWVYTASTERKRTQKTIYETLFVLPIIITAVVVLIKNSIALAFGLAGIVAGVQYRNRLRLSVEAAFLFAAIAVGVASGARAIGIAWVMSLWFCVTIVTLRLVTFEKYQKGGDDIQG